MTPPYTLFSKEINYDGGMVTGFLRNKSDPNPEPFPPGTRIIVPASDETPEQKGTIKATVRTNGATFITSSSASTIKV